jgi:CheY-like chemotaxis protein
MQKNLRNVCIIDDDVVFQMIMRVKIQKKELAQQFTVFDNGEMAIDFFKKEENWKPEILPDVVFLDINMPVMNGWEFIEKFAQIVNKLPKKISIYMLSSSIDDRDIERARNLPEICDFISKPIPDERLANILWTARATSD